MARKNTGEVSQSAPPLDSVWSCELLFDCTEEFPWRATVRLTETVKSLSFAGEKHYERKTKQIDARIFKGDKGQERATEWLNTWGERFPAWIEWLNSVQWVKHYPEER